MTGRTRARLSVTGRPSVPTERPGRCFAALRQQRSRVVRVSAYGPVTFTRRLRRCPLPGNRRPVLYTEPSKLTELVRREGS